MNTIPTHDWNREGYRLSTELPSRHAKAVHAFLSRSYWAEAIPWDVFRRSLHHSLNFGLLHDGTLVGFARVVSDRATFAWVGDVYVDEAHRGRGLARWMMRCIQEHPELQGLRRWCLCTRDAHPLYASVGFRPLEDESWWMEWRPRRRYSTEEITERD